MDFDGSLPLVKPASRLRRLAEMDGSILAIDESEDGAIRWLKPDLSPDHFLNSSPERLVRCLREYALLDAKKIHRADTGALQALKDFERTIRRIDPMIPADGRSYWECVTHEMIMLAEMELNADD